MKIKNNEFMKDIRELRKSKNKDMFITEIVKRAKQLNQRFYRLEKSDVNVQQSYAYQKSIQETGKEKPRYSVTKNKYKDMSLKELEQMLVDIDTKLASKTSTIRGAREINNKATNTLLDRLNIENNERNQKAVKEFFAQGGSKFFKMFNLDSDLLLEDLFDVISSGKSVKDYIDMLQKEINKYADRESEVPYSELVKSKRRLMKSGTKKTKRSKRNKRK